LPRQQQYSDICSCKPSADCSIEQSGTMLPTALVVISLPQTMA
jgi:hypothetical protein